MATYYFGELGNNAQAGTSFATRKLTYASLVSTLSSGGPHTVFMCAAASGSAAQWTCTEQINLISNVTYRVFPDHFVRLSVSTSSDDNIAGAINGNGVSNVVVEPLQGHLELGDIAQWNPNNSSNGHGYSARRQLNFRNCTNVHLIGTGTGVWSTTNSNFVVHGGNDSDGNQFWQNCSLFLIRGLDVSRHGTNNTDGRGDVYDDTGDSFVTYGDRLFIEKCCFALGGHANLTVKSRRTVVRTCDGNGDWDGITPNAGGLGGVNARSGGRAYNIIPGDNQHAALSPYGPVLMEDCILQRSGSAGDQKNNVLTKLDGVHVICRYNYFWDGIDAATINATHDDFVDGSMNYLKVYQNTFYRCGRLGDWGTDPGVVFSNVFAQRDLLNNIFDEGQGAYYYAENISEGEPWKTASFQRRANNEPLDGWPNEWKGGRYDGNIVRNGSGAPIANVEVWISYSPSGGIVLNFDAVDAHVSPNGSYSANWGAGNVMGTAPTYAGNPASGARTKATFAQNGGIAVGNAKPIAIAGAGSGTTTMTVSSGQARCFFDGWNMESLGLTPDWIVTKNLTTGVFGTPVQIAANGINEGADTIQLASNRTWTSGDGVFLALTPDGVNFTVVQDIGAVQTAGATIPATGVAGYIVLIGDGATLTVIEERDVGNVLTYTFTGLNPNKQYYFRVRAYDLGTPPNLGPYTSPRIFATTNP